MVEKTVFLSCHVLFMLYLTLQKRLVATRLGLNAKNIISCLTTIEFYKKFTKFFPYMEKF